MASILSTEKNIPLPNHRFTTTLKFLTLKRQAHKLVAPLVFGVSMGGGITYGKHEIILVYVEEFPTIDVGTLIHCSII